MTMQCHTYIYIIRGIRAFAKPILVLFIMRYFSRLYTDGWRDGLNRLWRDGVTILPRPAKNIATAKKQPSRPGPRKKKKTPPRPVPSKKRKKATPSRLGKKQQPPRPASGEEKNPPRPAMNSKIHRPECGNWKQIPPPVSFLEKELCLSPLLFLQIKVSVEPFVVGLDFAVANFLIVQVKKKKYLQS